MGRNGLLFILFILFCQHAEARFHVIGQAGYFNLNQPTQDSQLYLSGISKAFGIGMRKNYLEFEFLVSSVRAQADIRHDNLNNKIISNHSTVLFASNFYLKPRFYFRFGYGFNRVQQELDKSVSAASQAGATKAYNLKEDLTTGGVLLGGGVILVDAQSLDIYLQVENQTYSAMNAKSWNTSLGFRWSFE